MQERQLRRRANGVSVMPNAETVCAFPLSRTGAGGVADLGEDGDAVALGDRLAEC